jgi:exopolysaccharide production protein ExoF
VMLQPLSERTQTIYVTGEVNTPGSYPYRQGMLVLHGVSLAGGLFRPELTTSDEDRQIEVAGEIKRQRAQLAAISARIARIQAEMNGTDLVLAGSMAAEDVAREQKILGHGVPTTLRVLNPTARPWTCAGRPPRLCATR